MSEILEGSETTIREGISGDISLGDLAELRRGEMAGNNRKGVLATIDQRLGEVAAEIPTAGGFELAQDANDKGFAATQSVGTTTDARDEFSITPEMLLVAAADGVVEDKTSLVDAIGTEGREEKHLIEGGTVTHTRSKEIRMYRQSVTGWIPCYLPGSNVKMKLGEGFRAACPDCGSPVCRADGDPNGCAARDPVQLARCPVCRKPFYDHPREQRVVGPQEKDEMEIDLGLGAGVTPRDRLMMRVGSHVRAVHPQEGEVWGFGAQSPKDPEAGRPRERELERSAV